MTLIAYATSGDLATWTGTTPPTDADLLLRSASLIIAAAANRDPYTDAPAGDTATALRDATTAQVAAWIALGIDPAKLGIDTSPVKTKKLASAEIGYDTTGDGEARIEAATQLAPEAQKILYTAGLLALALPYWTDPLDPLADYGLDRPLGIGLRSPYWPAGQATDWWSA